MSTDKRQIFAIDVNQPAFIIAKVGDARKLHGHYNTSVEACKESRKLNDYHRDHRVVQVMGNVLVLSTLDTNKTKGHVGL